MSTDPDDVTDETDGDDRLPDELADREPDEPEHPDTVDEPDPNLGAE